jgi:hypothetical protein
VAPYGIGASLLLDGTPRFGKIAMLRIKTRRLWSMGRTVLSLPLLFGCSATPPPLPPPSWTTPEGIAQEAAQKRRGDELQKKWIDCEVKRARELSFVETIPAMVAVAKAIADCSAEREEWIRSQISPGISREMAESVANGADRNLVPLMRDYVIDLRAARARGPNTPPINVPPPLPPRTVI